MNLYIGQKIRSITNDLVEIVDIQGQKVKLLYKGKIYTLNKYLISKINKKLFILDNKIENKIDNKKKINENCESCKSCKNCMEMKNGNCFGSSSICSDYRHSPEISKDEIDRWPKIGDATYFRLHKYY